MQNLKSKAGTIYFGEDTAPRIVAIVQKWEGSTAQQRVALATLAAAAPELLAVVENLFAASDDNASASEIVNYINWQAARDALAKATGEEGAL